MTDQLRTIHLTLLLICLVLLAASFAEHRGPLKRAHDDAVMIQKWAGRNGDVVKALANEAASHSSLNNTNGNRLPYLQVSFKGEAVASLNRKEQFFYGRDGGNQDESFEALGDATTIYQWDKLEDFIRTWTDSYLAIDNPFLDARFDSRQVVGSTCGDVVFEPVATSDVGLFVNPVIFNSRTSEVRVHVDFSISRTCEVTLSLGKTDAVPLNLRRTLRSMVDGPLTTAPYNEAFPDLSEATKSLTSLSLDDLEAHLRDQANKEGEKLELFGAKIPYDLVSVFGAMLLIACQFYLWCHLVAFTAYIPKDKTTADTLGYIGLYTEKLAIRLFTLLSVSVVPCSVLALTLWSMRRGEWWQWITPIAMLPLSGFLGWLLVVSFRKLWLVKASWGSAIEQQVAASVGKS